MIRWIGYGPLAAALVLIYFRISDESPSAFWLYTAWTVLWSVLFTWIYNHTGRSILAKIALHALINISSETVGPIGDQEYARMVILAVVTLAVILIWGIKRWELSRRRLLAIPPSSSTR